MVSFQTYIYLLIILQDPFSQINGKLTNSYLKGGGPPQNIQTFKKLFLSKEALDHKSEKKDPRKWWGHKYIFDPGHFSEVYAQNTILPRWPGSTGLVSWVDPTDLSFGLLSLHSICIELIIRSGTKGKFSAGKLNGKLANSYSNEGGGPPRRFIS